MDSTIQAAADDYRRRFGWSAAEKNAFLKALCSPPPPAIRLQRGTQREQLPFALAPVPWYASAFYWHEPYRPGTTRHFAAGSYYVQDAGSTLALALLDPKPHEQIADLCAAPGGKATGILDRLGPGGFLLVNEPIRGRLGALQLNLARQGTPRFVLSISDPSTLVSLGPIFDAVLLDVPCSGQSLGNRQRRLASAFAPSTIAHCAARQRRLLRCACCLVRPGGRLVYSTCTFAPEENENIIAAFLEENADWTVEPVPSLTPWESPLLPGTYRLWPHVDPTAGAFGVRLRLQDVAISGAGNGRRHEELRCRSRPHRRPPLLSVLEACGRLTPADAWQSATALFATDTLRPHGLNDPNWLGPEVTHRRGQTWFPSHALAVRQSRDWQPAEICELDDIQAACYLRGQPITPAPDGWSVATWRTRPLGWLKGGQTVGKNRLPKAARLTEIVREEPPDPISP